MTDVETLQQLVRRRLRELGEQRGRDEPLTLAEAFRAVRGPEVTYEVMRRVEKGQHTRIGERAVRTIAAALQVDENDVRRSAGQRPALGRFELPERADKLQESERDVIVSVIDAILAAGETRAGDRKSSGARERHLRAAAYEGDGENGEDPTQ